MITCKLFSKSELETQKIAKFIAKYVKQGDVITLEGDLGVGKTTFTKGLAKGLQIDRTVTSPTFTIVKQYEGALPLYHIDAYRLEHSDEDIGFDEYFYGDGISVIEWAKFIEEFLPEERLHINIERIDQNGRILTFQAKGSHFRNIVEKLQHMNLGRM